MGGIDHPAITVGELQTHGIDRVRASCGFCRKCWSVPIDFLPAGTDLSTIAELLICLVCAGRGIKASSQSPEANMRLRTPPSIV